MTEQRGQKFSPTFSLYFREVCCCEFCTKRWQHLISSNKENKNGDLISTWHDIPLLAPEDPTNKVKNKQGALQYLDQLHIEPLLLGQTFNMVVEIPRFSQAKFEINRERPLNPIRQDVTAEVNGTVERWANFTLYRQNWTKRHEKLRFNGQRPYIRFLPNVFPWHGHVCNYGALPQTWESPYHQVGRKSRETNTTFKCRTSGRER